MWRGAVALMLVAVALAGCTDDSDGVGQDACDEQALCDLEEHFAQHFCVKNDVTPRVYAPDSPSPGEDPDPWRLGDFWVYRLTVDGQTQGETRLVYYDIQDNGAHYMVGVQDREEALQHAVLSTNPVIGRVHKVLYSPHEAGAHADMFHFPLCEGNTWTDVYFDTRFTFTAHHTDLLLPGGETDPRGFEIVGRANDGSEIRHTYSPHAKWFTEIDLDRADGLEVDLKMTDFGGGATGDAFFMRGQRDEAVPIAKTTRSAQNAFGREAGAAGDYDLLGAHLELTRHSGNGRVELALVDPDGQEVACIGLAGSGVGGGTDCPEGPLLLDMLWQAGEWTVRLDVAPLSGTEASADVQVASIYDRSGSV